MVIYAIVKGYLDEIHISNIDQYEHELMKSMDPNILSVIIQLKNITKQINNQLATFCQKLTHDFHSFNSKKLNYKINFLKIYISFSNIFFLGCKCFQVEGQNG